LDPAAARPHAALARCQLLPYYDKTGRFKSDALVAFATKEADLWVVGASVFARSGWRMPRR